MRLPFAKCPYHTMLWVSDNLVARVDYSCSRTNLRVGHIALKKLEREKTLQEAVTLAVGLVPNRPGPISILSPSFWTDFLTHPADVVSIARPDELAQALALDAEIDSGVSAFDSKIAFKQCESDEVGNVRFCVTQVSRTVLTELAHSLRAAGTRLQFVAHPFAFDLTCDLEQTQEELEAKLNAWNVEVKFHDREEALCRQWLDSFAGGILPFLSTKTQSTSLLLVPEDIASPKRRMFASVAMASVVAAGCFTWNHHIRTQIDATTSAIARIEQQQKNHVDATNSIKKATAKLVQLRKEASDTEQLVSNAQRLRQRAINLQVQRSMRWSLLVDALAKHAGECWVRRIVADGDRTSVLGLAPSNAQAHEFAMRLESSLREAGWIVAPAITHLTTNGLYEFTISICATEANIDWKTEPAAKPNQVVSTEATDDRARNPLAKIDDMLTIASSEALR